jgi:hypothetical protein
MKNGKTTNDRPLVAPEEELAAYYYFLFGRFLQTNSICIKLRQRSDCKEVGSLHLKSALF